MHPHIVEMMARENQRRVSEEINSIRMVKQASQKQGGLSDRILLALGELLIRIGVRIKQKYGPLSPTMLEAH